MRRGFESHLSAAFSLEKVVSGLVLCCVALFFFLFFSLSECLSIHVIAGCIYMYIDDIISPFERGLVSTLELG